MPEKLQAIRGMHDILPEQFSCWHFVEATVQEVLESYGYREIRFPILEKTELFSRSIGEVTDIVEKEMYTFADRNGDSLTLRPEGTASCVRACVENGLLHNQIQRLWYAGPMFRHERPQKGRYRQFYQVGAEIYGVASADADAELILASHRMWKRLGLGSKVALEINSLGTAEERARYKEKLVEFLQQHVDDLDEDSQRRLKTNPLRVLDSKNPVVQEIIVNAPVLSDFLETESREHFSELMTRLDQAGVKYDINPRLVRGLDYYSKTVFEWVTTELGAQGTVCAGGRYDCLVEQLGGKATPAIGFAMGLERIALLLEAQGGFPQEAPDVYIVASGTAAERQAMLLAELIRDGAPELQVIAHCGGGSFKSQFKKADKSGAALALIIGDDELERREVSVKFLREKKEQITVPFDGLVAFLSGEIIE